MTTANAPEEPSRTTVDQTLRQRARRVIPQGMYGHLSVNALPPTYPQFYARADGARVWDVDGKEYIDLMCSFGPIILGHQHAKVMASARAQLAQGDTLPGPAAVAVELAELLVDRNAGATWAMFAKNGSDATDLAVMIAKAQTGRLHVLAASGAYHGRASWSAVPHPEGVPDPTGTARTRFYTFNDLASVEAAAADGDVACIVVSPFRHDAGHDQELTDPAFARGLRALCDRIGSVLIVDEVRAGFRLHHGGSWEPFGVVPDLSAWSKGIANGFAIAAVLGNDAVRDVVERIYATGSFWFQAVPMAAAIATINALREENAIDTMVRAGTQLRDGLRDQAAARGLSIRQSGPVQMPAVSFEEDMEHERSFAFAEECARGGLIVHPRHNWFLCGAHTPDNIEDALRITDNAFAAVRRVFGPT
jgi:glutamate-1-semialdehyde 2,1-aminomutase